MIVAGIGFRREAPVAALRAALALTAQPVQALSTAAHKAGAPQIAQLAAELGLPLIPVAATELAAQTTLTRSPGQIARFSTGSLAEAAALAAAGPGARLIQPRLISACGMATAALAEGPET